MTTPQKEQLVLLRSQGESYSRIADALGLSENTVKSYCRRNGINPTAMQESEPDTVCDQCSQPLVQTPGSKHKRFCSDRCRMQWWYSHPEDMQRKVVHHFTCPICGIDFISYGNPKRIYCSRACFGFARKASRG